MVSEGCEEHKAQTGHHRPQKQHVFPPAAEQMTTNLAVKVHRSAVSRFLQVRSWAGLPAALRGILEPWLNAGP